MSDTQDIKAKYTECWNYAPRNEQQAFVSLIDHIFSEPPTRLNHLTFASFRRVINISRIELDDAALLKLIFHLVNQSQLLNIGYEIIEEDESLPVDLESIQEAKAQGWLNHPEDGHRIYNYEDRVSLYFSQSDNLLSLKSQAS